MPISLGYPIFVLGCIIIDITIDMIVDALVFCELFWIHQVLYFYISAIVLVITIEFIYVKICFCIRY